MDSYTRDEDGNVIVEFVSDDILQFYAFSADSKAGEGTGDCVNSKKDYEELNKIKNWRRMFSSFWAEDPFIYAGLTYKSYEHAYQAAKFRINGYEDYAFEFSLESKSNLSKNTGKEVQKAGRKIKLDKNQIDVWDKNMRRIKEEIYSCKFTRETRPGKALILTKDCILINSGPRIKKIRCTRLEDLRKRIR